MENVVDRWIRSGLVWVLLTMFYGMYVGISGEFALKSSHAHAGILGGLWSLAFAFLFSRKTTPPRFAFAQWLLFNIGVAVHVFALYMVVTRGGIWGMLIGVAGLLIIVSTLWIAASVWPRVAERSSPG